ncbi:MAG: ribosome biogenesis GTPase Der [Chlamydiales bacterium]
MSKIKLALVGRPNVGKSALFNRICGKRIAIVDEAEGVTRDRLYADAELFGLPFTIIDTGGIHRNSDAPFNEEIRRQAEIAIEEADTIVMVVDATVGITDLDLEVAQILQRTKKPVCVAINKVDNPVQLTLQYDFYPLGISNMIPVSANHDINIAELLEAAISPLDQESWVEEEEVGGIKVAIIGRPNVGKSSLINTILQDRRCVVSPIAGTTRDSIDVPVSYENNLYTFVDTAGIRRKHAEKEVVDKFAAIRTQNTIERADICLLMIDAVEGLTTQEKRIANIIEKEGKSCIVLVNKWDLVKGFRMEHCMRGIDQDAPFLVHCPKLFISALTGRNIEKIFSLINNVYQERYKRITTHQLNTFIERTLQKNHPPMIQGKRLRIYYMAQVGTAPPQFVLFVNDPKRMTETYKRYIYNQFRQEYGFSGVPILLFLKGKAKQKA